MLVQLLLHTSPVAYFSIVTLVKTSGGKTCGLYYENILTIVSDDHKLRLYYKCFISPSLRLG